MEVTYKFDAIGRRVFRDDVLQPQCTFRQVSRPSLITHRAPSRPRRPIAMCMPATLTNRVLRFKPSSSESLYYHRNQQYSVIALTNSSAAIVERYAYSAYGAPTVTNASGAVQTIGTVNNRYMYTGREWDQALGLYHYRARLYDANLGRFASRDPIGYEDVESSLYHLGYSRVTVLVDPSGLIPIPTDTVPSAPLRPQAL